MVEILGVGAAVSIFQLFHQIAKSQEGRIRSISASFDADGTRAAGDERIEVTKDKEFFRVKPVEDYEFLRIPVNPSGVIELLGTDENGLFDSDLWRWIRAPLPNEREYSYPEVKTSSSVRVRFLVFGYKSEDLRKVLGRP